MSPRRSVVDTRRTRDAILAHALDVASVEGLEGLTIGRLAVDLGLSKSGLLGHFGSKEALQLAVVEVAAGTFERYVAEPARSAGPGLPRLRAMGTSWVSSVESGVFPGGCFLIAAAVEVDDRPGRVRDAVAAWSGRWHGELREQAALAVTAGDLPPGTDPDQVVFELAGAVMAANHAARLFHDRRAGDHARRAIDRVLGRPALER